MAAGKKTKKDQAKRPSRKDIETLRKRVNAVTKAFFAEYGDNIDFLMIGPPGPRPPPKLEIKILNLSSY